MGSHHLDPHAVLNHPQYKSNTPDDKLRRKIATYFRDALASPLSKILPLLPEVMLCWGKVRIIGGDSIRTLIRHFGNQQILV
jgi:hypothetical protein